VPVDRPLRLAVVQLDSISQVYTSRDMWLPTEPLWSGRTTRQQNELSDRLAVRSLFLPDPSGQSAAVLEIEEVVTSIVSKRLRDILTFLGEQDTDVIVLPEYAVPVDSLQVLIDHSKDRAIVAGLGYIRTVQIAGKLAAQDSSFDVLEVFERNVAVLVENGHVHLVTKKHPADGERCEPGRGPAVMTTWAALSWYCSAPSGVA
jgi:hypothetical protein